MEARNRCPLCRADLDPPPQPDRVLGNRIRVLYPELLSVRIYEEREANLAHERENVLERARICHTTVPTPWVLSSGIDIMVPFPFTNAECRLQSSDAVEAFHNAMSHPQKRIQIVFPFSVGNNQNNLSNDNNNISPSSPLPPQQESQQTYLQSSLETHNNPQQQQQHLSSNSSAQLPNTLNGPSDDRQSSNSSNSPDDPSHTQASSSIPSNPLVRAVLVTVSSLTQNSGGAWKAKISVLCRTSDLPPPACYGFKSSAEARTSGVSQALMPVNPVFDEIPNMEGWQRDVLVDHVIGLNLLGEECEDGLEGDLHDGLTASNFDYDNNETVDFINQIASLHNSNNNNNNNNNTNTNTNISNSSNRNNNADSGQEQNTDELNIQHSEVQADVSAINDSASTPEIRNRRLNSRTNVTTSYRCARRNPRAGANQSLSSSSSPLAETRDALSSPFRMLELAEEVYLGLSQQLERAGFAGREIFTYKFGRVMKPSMRWSMVEFEQFSLSMSGCLHWKHSSGRQLRDMVMRSTNTQKRLELLAQKMNHSKIDCILDLRNDGLSWLIRGPFASITLMLVVLILLILLKIFGGYDVDNGSSLSSTSLLARLNGGNLGGGAYSGSRSRGGDQLWNSWVFNGGGAHGGFDIG